MDISEKIQQLMDEKQITAYRLAKDTGVSYTGLTKILSNQTKNPQIDSLQLIASFFGKSLNYFNDSEDSTSSDVPDNKRDFKKMLKDDSEVMYDGITLDAEDKEKIMKIMEVVLGDVLKKRK